MSVTFRAEPNDLSFVAFDYSLACRADERRDLRTFDTYPRALAARVDHFLYCGDEFCTAELPYVVARTPADDEPELNVSNVNARTLLRALGLVPELGADAVATAPADQPSDLADHDDLVGVCDSADLLARVDLALALSPVDAGVPWHETSARVIDCGRRAGWLQDRLQALRAVAVYAHRSRRRVDWC